MESQRPLRGKGLSWTHRDWRPSSPEDQPPCQVRGGERTPISRCPISLSPQKSPDLGPEPGSSSGQAQAQIFRPPCLLRHLCHRHPQAVHPAFQGRWAGLRGDVTTQARLRVPAQPLTQSVPRATTGIPRLTERQFIVLLPMLHFLQTERLWHPGLKQVCRCHFSQQHLLTTHLVPFW